MDIQQATRSYEAWLVQRIPLLPADLRLKHQRMAQSAVPFLRATFYRWVELWPQVCPELTGAPVVLGVGDLHIENFGTWRDIEGRLIWGVNDFDEVTLMPYTNDLVRLAVSAALAIREEHVACDPHAACDAILQGYQEAMERGGAPFVLAEKHGWLRHLALNELRNPVAFWGKLDNLPNVRPKVPAEVNRMLTDSLPQPNLKFRVVHRQAGLGSLGRRRFTALARWCGGMIAREAKELVISAWHCANRQSKGVAILYQAVLERAVRVRDPFVAVQGHWLLRRLAPDCSRVELASLPRSAYELQLLHAMGWETANIHLGTRAAVKRVQADLKKRPAKWLRRATDAMARALLEDWKHWARA